MLALVQAKVTPALLIVAYIANSLASLTILLPIGIGLRRRSELTSGQRWFMGYLALEFVTEAITFTLGRLHLNTHPVAYFLIPLESMVLMESFSRWQIDAGMRKALRIAALLMPLFWVPPLLGWEPRDNFSIGVESVQAICCLAAAAYTVVRRSMETTEQAQTQDWFMIGVGVMLYFTTFATMVPLAGYLLSVSLDTAVALFVVRSSAQVLSNAFYSHGMRCPLNPQHFGPSSSPPSSWGRFSWSRSGPRSSSRSGRWPA
jgi:hypothetical protein